MFHEENKAIKKLTKPMIFFYILAENKYKIDNVKRIPSPNLLDQQNKLPFLDVLIVHSSNIFTTSLYEKHK